MSEEEATSGKYWLSSMKPGIPLFAFCNMTTEGKYNITSIVSLFPYFNRCYDFSSSSSSSSSSSLLLLLEMALNTTGHE